MNSNKYAVVLVLGMLVTIFGAYLKINNNHLGTYVLIIGLALEAFILGSLVIKSLKK